MEPKLKEYLQFQMQHFINASSPTKLIFCNPEVLRETMESRWQSIVQGLDNFLKDIKTSGDILNIPTTDMGAFKVEENIAATEGKVVYQNNLAQLICSSK